MTALSLACIKKKCVFLKRIKKLFILYGTQCTGWKRVTHQYLFWGRIFFSRVTLAFPVCKNIVAKDGWQKIITSSYKNYYWLITSYTRWWLKFPIFVLCRHARPSRDIIAGRRILFRSLTIMSQVVAFSQSLKAEGITLYSVSARAHPLELNPRPILSKKAMAVLLALTAAYSVCLRSKPARNIRQCVISLVSRAPLLRIIDNECLAINIVIEETPMYCEILSTLSQVQKSSLLSKPEDLLQQQDILFWYNLLLIRGD